MSAFLEFGEVAVSFSLVHVSRVSVYQIKQTFRTAHADRSEGWWRIQSNFLFGRLRSGWVNRTDRPVRPTDRSDRPTDRSDRPGDPNRASRPTPARPIISDISRPGTDRPTDRPRRPILSQSMILPIDRPRNTGICSHLRSEPSAAARRQQVVLRGA